MPVITTENNNKIIEGSPLIETLPTISYGEIVYQNLLNKVPGKTALIDGVSGREITYGELLKNTCSLAVAMKNFGCIPTDKVAIISRNTHEYFYPLIASLYLGVTVTPINHDYAPLELSHVLKICKPKIIFCSETVFEKNPNLEASFDFVQKVIVIDENTSCEENLESFIDQNSSGFISTIDTTKIEDVSENIAFIMSSSGTTGLPKGVMLTHKNLLFLYTLFKDPNFFDHDQITLMILPFFHIYGLFTNLHLVLLGQLVVYLPEFQPKIFLNAIQQHKVTQLILVPPLVVFLTKSPLVEDYDLSSVKTALCAAAPLKELTINDFKKRLGENIIFKQAYGLTESTHALLMSDKNQNKVSSAGKVVASSKMIIRDIENGKFLGPNESGELCFKSELITKGYYENPEATKNSFTEDGWFRTGDYGYYDEENYVFITDRLKEIIKFNGYQVAPAELEDVLMSHPEIIDCGVIGIPNEKSGEVPLAFVVKSEQSNLTEENVKKFIEQLLSHQKWLRGGVIFVDQIPKTASGKILRRYLRKLVDN